MKSSNAKHSMILSPKGNCARMMLFLIAVFLVCFGGSLLAIGMYMQIKFSFITESIGSALAVIAIYICIVCGFLVLFISIIAFYSAHTLSRCNLILTLTFLLVLTILLAVGCLMAVLMRPIIADSAKQSMTYSLRRYYGKKKLITEAWDQLQIHMRCCAVDDNGWVAYNNSEWDIMVNSDPRQQETKISPWSPLYKFVPASCCTRLLDPATLWPTNTIRDLVNCQYWPYGPPNHSKGGHNDFVYYRGCFSASTEFLAANVQFLMAIGWSLLLLMISGLACIIILLYQLPNEQFSAIRKGARDGYHMPREQMGVRHVGMAY